MTDHATREYLQGYGSFAADFNRLFDQPVQVYEALQQAGLDYYALKDAGLETQDLGEIAHCRDAWKKRPVTRSEIRQRKAESDARCYGTSPFMSPLPEVRDHNAKVERDLRETSTPASTRK